MNYTVLWKREVIEDGLTEALVSCIESGLPTDPLVQAVCQIMVWLTRDPDRVGIACTDSTRVYVAEPIAVLYQVDEQTRLVRVQKFCHCPPQFASS